MIALLAVNTTLATSASPTPANADNWPCQVALCISNPAGAMAVSECVPPIKRLYRQLEHGGSFPLCHSGDVDFTRYGLEWQDNCPKRTRTVYRRDDSDHGPYRRWRYCQRFIPIESAGDGQRWLGRDRNDGVPYQVRIIDGERIIGKIVTARAPLRKKPRFLEYVVRGDTRRIWW